MGIEKEKLKAAKKFGIDIQQEFDKRILKKEAIIPPRNQMSKKEVLMAILKDIKELFLSPFRKK